MRLDSMIIDSNLQSQINYGSIAFPLEIFFEDLCNYDLGFVRWHWHKEVQFGFVKKGTVEFFFLDKSFKLSEGDGVFINSSILHQIKPVIPNSVVIDIVFNPIIIGGHSLSLIDRNYVSPIVDSDDIDYLILDNKVNWKKDILIELKKINYEYVKKEFGYEISMKKSLCDLWLILASELILNSNNFSYNKHEGDRIKVMLEYIHNNVANNVTLKNIANSVHISSSECCRCFKKNLKMSPFEYLMQYRIIEASNILKNTNKPISEIMSLVGFNDASYFTKIFKRFTNYTPTQYRKQFK